MPLSCKMAGRVGLYVMLLLCPLSLLFAGKPKADQPFYECSYEHPASTGPCATSPVAIHAVLPEYSEEARQAQLAGEVVVALVVGKKGVPSDVHVVKSLGKGLDERAIAAVEQWKFTPGTFKGHAVAVSVTLPIYFQHCDTPGAYRIFPAPGSEFSIAEAELGKKTACRDPLLHECRGAIGVSSKTACAPELIHAPNPEYSDEARQAGVQGVVVLRLVVNERGSARDVRVVQSIAQALDEPAVAAVKQWKFVPALCNDQPIAVNASVALEFGQCKTFSVSAGPLGSQEQSY